MRTTTLLISSFLLATACNGQSTGSPAPTPLPAQTLKTPPPAPANGAGAAAAPGRGKAGEADDDDDDEDGTEESASLFDLPGPAQATIKRIAGKHAITEVEKETHLGVTVFEAEYEVDGREHSVVVSATGDLIEVEKEIEPSSLPAEILAAIDRRFPGAAIREAEVVHAGGSASPTYYEVEFKSGGKHHEVKVRPSGEIF